ncbi:hypothetical protein MKX01_014251 [Papaver californicum]|nr:hypothetical protein MKX01_014251 [Papaver californicum]
MVEFLALWLSNAGISPLILTRGYAGGDEARMLQRHLLYTSTKIGIALELVLELLSALQRADIAVIHHADLRTQTDTSNFFTRLAPSCFFNVKDCDTKLPLRVRHNMVILCVSAIGSANAFVWAIEKVGPAYVDRMDFIDHYLFQTKHIEMILEKLRVLQIDYGTKPAVVVTEKDYDRDSLILKRLDPFEVLVLCSRLEIVPSVGNTEKTFQKLLKQLLKISISTREIP